MSTNNTTNILTVEEILQRLPDAGTKKKKKKKKRKQLMRKLLRRLGATAVWRRLAQSAVEESTDYLNDGRDCTVTAGWGYVSISDWTGEEVVRDIVVSEDVCDVFVASIIKKALTCTKW